MPTYTEPSKTNPTYTEPSKTSSSYTEPGKSDVGYLEPQWIGATWKNICGVTWKDLADITWKTFCKIFGSKVSSPTYTENEKGTVIYTEPSKE